MPKTGSGSVKLTTLGGVFTPSILTILGLILFLRIGCLDGALGVADRLGERFAEAEVYRLEAEALLSRGNRGAAAACLERALGVARGQHVRSFGLRAATSLARLWQRQDKRAEARDLLQPVDDWFTERFDTRELKDVKALLEELGCGASPSGSTSGDQVRPISARVRAFGSTRLRVAGVPSHPVRSRG